MNDNLVITDCEIQYEKVPSEIVYSETLRGNYRTDVTNSFITTSDENYLQSRFQYEDIFIQKSEKFLLIGNIDKDIKIKKPFPLKVIYSIDQVTYEIPELGIYSFAEDFEEAFSEIKEELIDLIKVLYEEDDENLGELPRSWKEFLDVHIYYN